MTARRTVAVFTGNRAEYGLQFPILRAIDVHPGLEYRLVAGGAHLDEDFGATLDEIHDDGFKVHAQVDVGRDTDTLAGTALAIGCGIVSVCAALERLHPDWLVVYGDRYESFAALVAASQMGIPTAHVEGGDYTDGGALDDSVRHAMTKLAHLHFTTNADATERVLRLGEEPWRVHTVGLPSLDLVASGDFAGRDEVLEGLGLTTERPIHLFCQHSVATEADVAVTQLQPSLAALRRLAGDGHQIVVTYPNNDAGGRRMIVEIESLHDEPGFVVVKSLGRRRFLGVLDVIGHHARGAFAGNSSAGIKRRPPSVARWSTSAPGNTGVCAATTSSRCPMTRTRSRRPCGGASTTRSSAPPVATAVIPTAPATPVRASPRCSLSHPWTLSCCRSGSPTDMKARNQAKIYARARTPLETVIPLETPYSVEIDVCSACNFKCSFCFQADRQQVRRSGITLGRMEMPLFEKIVGDLRAFPDRIRKVRLFEFGEPLLHPQLPEMIRAVNTADVTDHVEITTNGLLLTEKLNLELVDAGLSQVNISVSGITEERYREVSGVKVDLARFTATLEHLHRHKGDLHIYVKLADDGSLSKADEQEFYRLFGDSCDDIFIERVSPIWRDTDINEGMEAALGPYGQPLTYKDVCPLIFTRMVINPDGVVVACCVDWKRQYVIGDLTQDSASDVWNGPALRDLRVRHLRREREDIELCRGCTALMSCTIDDVDAHAEAILGRMCREQGDQA